MKLPDSGPAGTNLGTVTTDLGYTGFGELSHLSATAGVTSLYDAQYVRDSLLAAITMTVPAFAQDPCSWSQDVRLVNGKFYTMDTKNAVVNGLNASQPQT